MREEGGRKEGSPCLSSGPLSPDRLLPALPSSPPSSLPPPSLPLVPQCAHAMLQERGRVSLLIAPPNHVASHSIMRMQSTTGSCGEGRGQQNPNMLDFDLVGTVATLLAAVPLHPISSHPLWPAHTPIAIDRDARLWNKGCPIQSILIKKCQDISPNMSVVCLNLVPFT